MGSSKTANALITKFNYEERGMKVWLIKPSTDTRDGAAVVQSRIGLMAEAEVITPEKDIFSEFGLHSDCDVIIADECQFLTAGQIDDLRRIVDELDVPVLCF
jgi:thymidine kinase